MDPVFKNHAVALRIEPVTNTSAQVEWLGLRGGRFFTRMRGAYRPKSFLIGQFDLFYTCELVLQTSRSGRLHIRECYPLKSRVRFRTDWKATCAASYLSGLFSLLVPWKAPSEEEYRLLNRLLDDLASETPTPVTLCWMELSVLQQAGLRPNFGTEADNGYRLFDVSRGRFLESARDGQTRHGPDIRAILRKIQAADDPHRLSTLRLRPSQGTAIEILLESFISHHLEISPESRRITFDALRRKPAAIAT